MNEHTETPAPGPHFIHEIVEADLKAGRCPNGIVTRFPPEPNGYLHIGHAKAICLDFGTARKYGGRCHLRMDDTNPVKEDIEYIRSIEEDVRWLGFDWGAHFYYASDFFGEMYDCAVQLIRKGKAYVCALSQDEWKDYRGVPERPGRESPWRDRPVEENLDLFTRMRAGEFPNGALCLRARIDMASPNLHMRDPVIYRILHAAHPHTGDAWRVYPTYDFAHPLEDALEGITHSLCTLEFEVHRPLYDWVIDNLDGLPSRPRQYEFARLNLSYTVMSKRFLLDLVTKGAVAGWDDPRLPTLCGLRRRGFTPASIRAFCETVGITKYESLTDVALLEHCVRDDLNRNAERRMAVLDPVKVVIENYPEGRTEDFEAVNNPEDPAAGTRPVPFSREIYIERADFMEDPPKKFFRLAPGAEVRLRYACLVRCTGVIKDEDGNIEEIRCVYDPDSRGGTSPDGRKVKGTLHWVSAAHAQAAEIRLYDRLFSAPEPMEEAAAQGVACETLIHPDSLKTVRGWVEPALANAAPGARFQFERVGYFCADTRDHAGPDRLVFNRTVTLKDSWSKARGPVA